jgi:hypothetical protein
VWPGWGLDIIMKKDEINKALWEYYRVATEESRVVGTQLIRLVISAVMAISVLLTFIVLVLTQVDKIVFAFNLVTIGIIAIGAMLSLIFILLAGYAIFMKVHGINIAETVMNIEKLQRDMLFEEICEAELKERFQKIYPYLYSHKLTRERKKFKDFFNKYIRWRIE